MKNVSEREELIILAAEEFFKVTPHHNETELRDFIKGDPPVDAGKTYPLVRGNSYSLLIYSIDYESLRYKQRQVFAENVNFSAKDITSLMKKYEITNFQARALNFLYLIYLCEMYENKAVETHKMIVGTFMDETFVKIETDLYDENLIKYRTISQKDKEIFKDSSQIFVNLEILEKYVHKFIKVPNVGRPANELSHDEEKERLSAAIRSLLEKKLPIITDVNSVEDILKVTKFELCEDPLEFSRPTLDKRLLKLGIDFTELVEKVRAEFLRMNRTNPYIDEYLRKTKDTNF